METPSGHKQNGDEIGGFFTANGDSEERLYELFDSGLTMGTETDGSICSVLKFPLFPAVKKISDKLQALAIGFPYCDRHDTRSWGRAHCVCSITSHETKSLRYNTCTSRGCICQDYSTRTGTLDQKSSFKANHRDEP